MGNPQKLSEPTPSPVVGPSKPRLWQILGPGLITGAVDDDPSGIATYSQAGAQFEFGLAWTLVFSYPLMVVIQAISARIGRTTGRGIAGNIRVHYANWVLQTIVALLFLANTCNIGADLGAMAEASRLLAPSVPAWIFLLGFSVVCMGGQVFFQYTRYVSVLKWLTLSLFSYFAVLCVVHVSWLQLLKGLVWPTFSADRDFWLMVVAILGTTISPYLFFWQPRKKWRTQKRSPFNSRCADARAKVRSPSPASGRTRSWGWDSQTSSPSPFSQPPRPPCRSMGSQTSPVRARQRRHCGPLPATSRLRYDPPPASSTRRVNS